MRRLALICVGLVALAAGVPALAQGTPKSFKVTAKQDLCIDVSSGRTDPGTPVQLWKCTGGGAQQFILDPELGKVRFALNMDLCVDQVAGDRRLQLVNCDNTINKWRYDAGKKRFTDGKTSCWDVPSAKFVLRQRMQIWTCNNLPPQSFTKIDY